MAKVTIEETPKAPEPQKPTITSTSTTVETTVNPATDPNATAEERITALETQQEAGR